MKTVKAGHGDKFPVARLATSYFLNCVLTTAARGKQTRDQGWTLTWNELKPQ